MTGTIAYRANKSYFYHGSDMLHVEFSSNNQDHVTFHSLLLQLNSNGDCKSKEYRSLYTRASCLAKKIGFKSATHVDFIHCDSQGYIDSKM